jgi:hypothetical protein
MVAVFLVAFAGRRNRGTCDICAFVPGVDRMLGGSFRVVSTLRNEPSDGGDELLAELVDLRAAQHNELAIFTW